LHHPNVIFFGGILAGTVAALAALLGALGAAAHAVWPVVTLLALVPASQVAVSLVNQLVTAFLPPRILPKLEFRGREGIPARCRTAVVVPVIFDSVDGVREALEHLEAQFLANRDPHLHFAILSDLADAPTETREGDDEIVAAAADGIRREAEPPAPVEGDAYEREDLPPLPGSLESALAAFEADAAFRAALGETFADYYAVSRRWELRAWREAVSDWERERYERAV
jgi:cyclic beta-1,2-glucan synthetase